MDYSPKFSMVLVSCYLKL